MHVAVGGRLERLGPSDGEVTCGSLGAPARLGRPPRGGRSCPLLSRCADFHPRPSRPISAACTLHRTPAKPSSPRASSPARHDTHTPCRARLPVWLSTAAGSSLTTPSLDPAALRRRSPIHTVHHLPRAHPPSLPRPLASHLCRAQPPAPTQRAIATLHCTRHPAPSTVATACGPCSSNPRPATAPRVDNSDTPRAH